MRAVVGLFENGNEARRTIDELTQMGFASENISVVTNLASQSAIEARSAVRLRPMNLSDVGKIATTGPLCNAINQRTGLSGLADALKQYGLSSELAEHYANGVQHGDTLESLMVDDGDADRVVAVMKRHTSDAPKADIPKANMPKAETAKAEIRKAAAISTMGVVGAAPMTSKVEYEKERISPKNGHNFSEEDVTIPIYREELQVGKREIEKGTVRVTVHVNERPAAEQVVLREEHVDIERRPANRLVRPEETMFKDGQYEMTEVAEEAVASKQARLVEEVVVHKHVIDKRETVGDTLRSTEVDVKQFDLPEFRRHFQNNKIAGSFDEYIPAYKFGYAMARLGAAGDRWEASEQRAKERWEAEHAGTWEKFKEAIRYGWSRK